jgi:hypothetical protein
MIYLFPSKMLHPAFDFFWGEILHHGDKKNLEKFTNIGKNLNSPKITLFIHIHDFHSKNLSFRGMCARVQIIAH